VGVEARVGSVWRRGRRKRRRRRRVTGVRRQGGGLARWRKGR